MMLGFKRRFAPMVRDGSKTHTIRAKRKRAPRQGEPCHCYVDPRQKTMALLGRWRCVKVEDIQVNEQLSGLFEIRSAGVALSLDESNAFAWRDGFRDRGPDRAFESMMAFWKATHGRKKRAPRNGRGRRPARLKFFGDVIPWDRRQPVAAPARRARRTS
jgi:hypothetical protein